MTTHTRLRLRLPRWTAHPGFGVAVLLVLAAVLIVHGEPQPSARDNGRSVVVTGSPSAPVDPVAGLVVHGGKVEWRLRDQVRPVTLPRGAVPGEVITSHGLSVVLAVLKDRQHAYAVRRNLQVIDLGFADAVIPSVAEGTAVLVESAVQDAGAVGPEGAEPPPTPSTSNTNRASPSDSSSTSAPRNDPPPLRDFYVQGFSAAGQPVGGLLALPTGMQAAVDTAVGLVAWKPVNRVIDAGIPGESLSAAATLIRPDGSTREIGPVHPLAASDRDLLVWNVSSRQFGLMPLNYVTATETSTASPSVTPTETKSGSGEETPKPKPSPSTVAGTRWFNQTRGLVVTGPASFGPGDSAFAVYALVGNRRRLVVSNVGDARAEQIEVLALAQPTSSASPSASTSATPSVSVSVSVSVSPSDTTSSASASATVGAPVFHPDGFPISAPLIPIWWGSQVVAVGNEGTVAAYEPGSGKAVELDLGTTDVVSIALAP
ncbi:MAG: hypothetical protein JWN95_3419 [Frankiales bacterium]|nr:hypothetical protein [Frankiales bacterium]